MAAPLRLLMVEDSEDDAEIIRFNLERVGFELDWRRVESEAVLEEALEEQWDLIISELRIRRLDGLVALALCRERRLDVPFIFVSSEQGVQDAVKAMRAGACDYLLKGNLTRLPEAVRRALAEAEGRAERRWAAESSQREQRRLVMAVEASGAAVFEYRVLGTAIYLSDRWAEILGYRREELPREGPFEAWLSARAHPDDAPLFARGHVDFIAGRIEQYETEVRMRHKAGHWVDVAVVAKAVERDRDGRAAHVVGVVLDMTERRKLEAQLRQAQKMEAVGRLAGGTAHDFNNLLTAIFSFGKFVLEELNEGDLAYKDMEEVLAAAKKAEGLTAQLLAFSRQKPISPRNIDINGVLRGMTGMLPRVVGEDVDVATRIAENLWTVRLDPGSLEQVIVNLAMNARDAIRNGGTLTIETENVELDEEHVRLHGSAVPPGQYVMLAVSDDGIGMDEATRLQVFEPFFTTKGTGRGTGLGLSTCYGIIKQVGGEISVDSTPGEGTTFRVWLPRVVEEAEPVTPKPKPRGLKGTEVVLVVEDDDQVRRLACRALTRLGYRVIAASNGGEALLRCEDMTEGIDLLITDVVMPEISGRQLVDRLVPLRPSMKVLYMSGYTADAMLHRGVVDSETHVLHKPFTPDRLAAKVREVLDE